MIRKQTKKSVLKPIIWITGLFLLVLAVFTMIESVTTGAELTKILSDKAKYTQENQDLANDLIKSSSLNQIGDKADILGYVKPTNIVYVAKESGFAAKLP
jgi:hypothetical protein